MDASKLRLELPCATAPPRPDNDDTVDMVRSSRTGGRAVARASMPSNGAGHLAEGGPATGDSLLRRLRQRKLSHDIRHELATIMLLASLLESAPDVGPDSRQRARQILGETRWLEQLQRAYDSTVSPYEEQVSSNVELIPLHIFAAEVLRAVRLSTSTATSLTAEEAWVRAERLACWRVLRNMVDNAVRAAGPNGQVDVRVENQAGWVMIRVDDDGPGFGAVPPGSDSLGLDIVQEFAIAAAGHLEIGRSVLGGCRVGLGMPAESLGTFVEPGDDSSASG